MTRLHPEPEAIRDVIADRGLRLHYAPHKQWLIRYAAYTHLVEQIARRPAAWNSLFSCIYTRYIADIDRFAAASHWTLSRLANGTPHPTFTAVHCCGYTVTVRPAEYQHICRAFQGYM